MRVVSRGRQTFRQRDVTRMVAGVVAAGVDVREVVVDMDGRIRVIAGKPGNTGNPVNALDQWMAAHAGKA